MEPVETLGDLVQDNRTGIVPLNVRVLMQKDDALTIE
jgi:hypothetical protein